MAALSPSEGSALLPQPGGQRLHPRLGEGGVGLLAVELDRRVDQCRPVEERTPRARDQDVAVEQAIGDRELRRHVDLGQDVAGVEVWVLGTPSEERLQVLVRGLAGTGDHRHRYLVRPGARGDRVAEGAVAGHPDVADRLLREPAGISLPSSHGCPRAA
jgi:hypothetical protein